MQDGNKVNKKVSLSVNEDDERRLRKISLSSLEKRRMTRRMSRTTFLSTGGSTIVESLPKKPLKLENTYRMAPKMEEKFSTAKAKKALRDVMQSFLEDKTYGRDNANIVKQLSDIIKNEMKEVISDRHKIVCWLVLGEKFCQSLQGGSKCLWDSKTDNYVSETYSNNSLFVNATVYALYCE
ncbi:DgyrCDS10414 [Dimorphilus gyrociliatus]|uniref:DgyrCDS10414 n=1 Tax=Dimorphilus gyrociliatus TaxID=2664684 RepID=A0A7I8W1B4_9ANNE|nr:DgyrCDS10414 [Dimorphilus gyrociliatus]